MVPEEKNIIIVAGGKGVRMGAEMPKQFIPLQGKPILMHTLEAFYLYDPGMKIFLVLPEMHIPVWQELCREYHFKIPHQVVAGGETRFHSVKNALTQISANGFTGIHDGVRPLVSREVISRCYDAALKYQAVIPVLPVVESIRELGLSGESSRPVDRTRFRIVQTPQVFRSDILLKAYAQPYHPLFTDDASVVENTCKIHLVEGNRENIKITTPEDLVLANAFLSE